MNRFLILLLLLAATYSFGQSNSPAAPGISVDTAKSAAADTALRVVYADKMKAGLQPAIFINGRFVMGGSLLNGLDPRKIENIDVIKADTLIDNIHYSGKVQIKTKSDYNYNPKSISLTEVKNKYTNLKGKPVLFIIDGNFVNADYDKYMIDENSLLTIIIDKFQNVKENIDLGLIKLLTKSEENIKNRKQCMIRVTEFSLNK
jgi:hypothetical protein